MLPVAGLLLRAEAWPILRGHVSNQQEVGPYLSQYKVPKDCVAPSALWAGLNYQSAAGLCCGGFHQAQCGLVSPGATASVCWAVFWLAHCSGDDTEGVLCRSSEMPCGWLTCLQGFLLLSQPWWKRSVACISHIGQRLESLGILGPPLLVRGGLWDFFQLYQFPGEFTLQLHRCWQGGKGKWVVQLFSVKVLNCCSEYSHFWGSFTTFTACVWHDGAGPCKQLRRASVTLSSAATSRPSEGQHPCASSLLRSGFFLRPRAHREWRNHSAGVKCCFPHSRASVRLLVCSSTISQLTARTGHLKSTCKGIVTLYASL